MRPRHALSGTDALQPAGALAGLGATRGFTPDSWSIIGQTPAYRQPRQPHGQDHPTLRHRRAQAESWRVLGLRTCGIVGLTRRRPVGKTVATPRIGGGPSRSATAVRKRNRGGSWGSGRAASWVSRVAGRSARRWRPLESGAGRHARPPPCAGGIVAGPGAPDVRHRGSHASPAGRQDGGDPSNRGRAVTRRQRGMLLPHGAIFPPDAAVSAAAPAPAPFCCRI